MYISRVQFQYGGSWAPRHADNLDPTDSITEILLEFGEVLTGIDHRSGAVIDSLQFVTNLRSYPKIGGNGGGGGSVSGVEVKFFVGDVAGNGLVSQLRAVFMECWRNDLINIWYIRELMISICCVTLFIEFSNFAFILQSFCEMLIARMHNCQNMGIRVITPTCLLACWWNILIALRWRHNELDSVSNHQPQDCILNRLFRCRSKKTSKLRVTGLCAGNSPGTDEFPAQMASYAENVSIWWRHHGPLQNGYIK